MYGELNFNPTLIIPQFTALLFFAGAGLLIGFIISLFVKLFYKYKRKVENE